MTENRQSVPQTKEQAREQARVLLPPVDIVEDDSGIKLIADLPGVSKEGLSVNVDSDTLVIEGRALVDVPQDLDIRTAEIPTPFYRRTFTLSRELDTTKIEANLKDGVLRLHIPKSEKAKPKRIEVKVG